MPNFTFTAENISHIRTAISENKLDDKVKVWEHKLLKSMRRELKQYILSNRNDGFKCAYCLKDFHNEHNMNIDVEHILPKSQYPEYTFTLKNLAVACKRCNLLIKRNDVSFLNANFIRKNRLTQNIIKYSILLSTEKITYLFWMSILMGATLSSIKQIVKKQTTPTFTSS
ncbi:HNH endonuclease [Escherichia coli]|uniref:HNH endonuclease n=1 Tax=Escherichia coli TaxID=562 RepID=UPI001ABD2801|nr:HNH endonuclease signature motif containing protein [Escherichia coli]